MNGVVGGRKCSPPQDFWPAAGGKFFWKYWFQQWCISPPRWVYLPPKIFLSPRSTPVKKKSPTKWELLATRYTWRLKCHTKTVQNKRCKLKVIYLNKFLSNCNVNTIKISGFFQSFWKNYFFLYFVCFSWIFAKMKLPTSTKNLFSPI